MYTNSGISCVDCEQKCLKDFGLKNSEIEALNKNSRQIRYDKGETVIKQNAFVSHIIYLRKGICKILLEGLNGKNVIVKFIPSNHFIGLPALFSSEFYPYTATALKSCEVCIIEINFFRKIITENPAISQSLLKLFSKDYSELFLKVLVLGTKQLHGRLAEAILYMCRDEFTREDLFSSLTRKDMAELSSMSTESMIRLFNEFKSDKIISMKGKKIIIQDMDMLIKLSQAG